MLKQDTVTIKGKVISTDVEELNLLNYDLTNKDIEPLKYCENLKWLNLHWNQISDVTPLAGLLNLRAVFISGNQIADISPLSKLPHIKIEEIALQLNQQDYVMAWSETIRPRLWHI